MWESSCGCGLFCSRPVLLHWGCGSFPPLPIRVFSERFSVASPPSEFNRSHRPLTHSSRIFASQPHPGSSVCILVKLTGNRYTYPMTREWDNRTWPPYTSTLNLALGALAQSQLPDARPRQTPLTAYPPIAPDQRGIQPRLGLR